MVRLIKNFLISLAVAGILLPSAMPAAALDGIEGYDIEGTMDNAAGNMPVVGLSDRENVTDWYIKSFDTRIVVNKDSTLDITERIIADCGNATGKHGIFRILPEGVKIEGKFVKMPVKLASITDQSGNEVEFSESKDWADHTVTWKIGDPDVTVQGENFYEIHYTVQDTIRFGDPSFDEFYWNLSGNFWELEIDSFHADIVFPSEINQDNSTVDYYTGPLGSKSKDQAIYRWTSPNVLSFDSVGRLEEGDGITASVTFPKNVILPRKLGFWEKYGNYISMLAPLAAFFIGLHYWRKYGKDPEVDKTVIAQYDVPGKLSPIEVGLLMDNGTFSNELVTAEIVNLAVKGLLEIKETNEKVLIFKMKDYELAKKSNPAAEAQLNRAQKTIYNRLFDGRDKVELSSLKNSFYKVVETVEEQADRMMKKKQLLTAQGESYSTIFIVVGILLMVVFFLGMVMSEWVTWQIGWSLIMAGLVTFIFGLVMPKRTLAGANLNWEVKGFKLFMETVDKHRAEFYEKEFIFEKFLPYAIVFGITGLWIKKMKEIYGEEYFASHSPVWYTGHVGSFDADSFSSAMSSLSSSVASNTSSPSGSGGSGGSGGGGGGGGGGGW